MSTIFHDVKNSSGRELGYTFFNGRNWTLVDTSGITLVRVAQSLAEAIQALHDHDLWFRHGRYDVV